MNTYECLQDEACGDGIDVIDYTFHSDRIKGLYCDGTVAIRKDMNTVQKACTLAEELGHHHTSVGDIIDINSVENRKQERQARLHGYNRLIGLVGIIHAFNAGCQNKYEIADFLDVTEEYLEECISCYRDKYGVYTTVDNYIIYFIPNLVVVEMMWYNLVRDYIWAVVARKEQDNLMKELGFYKLAWHSIFIMVGWSSTEMVVFEMTSKKPSYHVNGRRAFCFYHEWNNW